MTTTENIRDIANREAIRQAPVDDVYPSGNAGAQYRCGFRDAVEWLVRDADALAAVATELNVEIINRADLPTVRLHTDHGHGLMGPTSVQMVTFDYGEQGHTECVPVGMSGDELIALGLELNANPPVDQADVDALASLLKDDAQFGLGRPDADDIARRLVQAGVRPPKDA